MKHHLHPQGQFYGSVTVGEKGQIGENFQRLFGFKANRLRAQNAVQDNDCRFAQNPLAHNNTLKNLRI